jgi:peptidoglycan/xylan/chitin deacetylase (PgdA/CDA1 family)
MQWIEGTVPPAARILDTPTTAAVTATSEDAASTIPPTATALVSPPVSGDAVKLTAEQLKHYKPDELGLIPVLEYHVLTTDDSDNEQFVRPISKFKQDLQWLYDHNFYVITLHDLINNTISAPAGKHPFAMTFDDSTTGQFRFLVGANGSVSVDPNSGVGILEDFFAKHPDFGHTAFFAVIATDSFCFDWQGNETDADQEKYCGQKITWLLDHGYEIGNHTVDHVNLQDVSDDKFVAELGGDFDWAKSKDPRALPDILAMPFGMYPDLDKHKQQRTWLREGFTYNGQNYKINGVLEVGANPAVAPDSTDWDPVWIPRIQAFDADAKVQGGGGFDTWFPDFENRPETLYTSDGNPNTITVPNSLPIDIDGTLDANKIASEGKQLIRYDG